MRGAYLNLAVSLFVLTEPGEKIHIKDKAFDQILLGPVKAIPPNWTVWDRIDIKGPLTLGEFIKHMQTTYNVDTSIITSQGVTLIQTFMPSNKDRLTRKIEDVFNTNSKYPLKDNITYIPLEISADTEDGSTALMPMIKYTFR
jgi:ubiquitin-activating enzyme E1